ncbi:1-acyl-sn-glycerol-3-phosphate acyltransferase [Membranicola marinus]|uniref:1-acyl-sn-glycerol-3-phosphate acyltransferase n=1 Tax=Membranihabitans marinus TaxID=1227546 RepID=A0A953L5G7_9BACT|nr:1-acyl-sn-glycerol-3-phosphate acyltransferase [Membranihabitans marinus]MBY5956562.1 1-acyl-sn-glycerol-3-phosphate acyltransferase [Membranihabitans marinus]
MHIKQVIAKKILALFGWEVTGDAPCTEKGLFVVAPHTHWQDFPLGLLVRQYLGLNVRFIAKKSLFSGVKGRVFRLLGGYPVDRSRSQGYVQSVAAIFDQHERFYIAIAPEGTRRKVERLKTGFYYIALEAQVPMYLTAFDYSKKKVHITGPVWPDPSNENQFDDISAHFSGVQGRVPAYSFTKINEKE